MDYSRKAKPLAVGFANCAEKTPQAFAHALDSRENRKNSQVAREIILALPASVTAETRAAIANAIGAWCVRRWDAPLMAALHAPDKRGDQRNFHAHFVVATRNRAGAKLRQLDEKDKAAIEIAALRAFASAEICRHVPAAERPRWTHLSLAAQGVSRPATQHEGPQATALRRRGGALRHHSAAHNDAVREALAAEAAAHDAETERAAAQEALKIATSTHSQEETKPQKQPKMNNAVVIASTATKVADAMKSGASKIGESADAIGAALRGDKPQEQKAKELSPQQMQMLQRKMKEEQQRKQNKGMRR